LQKYDGEMDESSYTILINARGIDNMIELPISNCMKEHYKKQNAVFTDSERATFSGI